MRIITTHEPAIPNPTPPTEESTSDGKEAATVVPEELIDCKETVKLDIERLNRLYDELAAEAAEEKPKTSSSASRPKRGPSKRKRPLKDIKSETTSATKKPRTSFSTVARASEDGSKYIRATYSISDENIFDKCGDLLLSVSCDDGESNATNFLVSSRVVVANSSTFGRMLDVENGFQEGEKLRKWQYGMTPVVIHLEDDPEPLHLVLQILFHQNKDIKRQLTVKEFYKLAVLADKYDLQSTLDIWVNIWRKDSLVNWRSQDGKHPPEHAPLVLMIAWTFGLEKEFWFATSRYCKWHYHPEKEYIDTTHPRTEFPSIPDCVFESLLTYHTFLRTSLRDLYTTEQTLRATAPIGLPKQTFCTYRPPRRTAQHYADTTICDLYQLGLISHTEPQDWFQREIVAPLKPGFKNETLCDVPLSYIFAKVEGFGKVVFQKLRSLGGEMKLYHCPKAAGVDVDHHRCNCSALSEANHKECSWIRVIQKKARVLKNVGIPLGEFRSRREVFGVLERNAFLIAGEMEEKGRGKGGDGGEGRGEEAEGGGEVVVVGGWESSASSESEDD